MLERLQNRLDTLFSFLFELGNYQLEKQNNVATRIKSDASLEEAWQANDVVSEVDLNSEKRILAFLEKEFGPVPVISEEFNAKHPPGEGQYRFVIDPLDGTKPYLEGKPAFGISVGLMRGASFEFGATCYPADRTILYALPDSPGVMDQDHRPLPVRDTWTQACYLSLGFYDLLRPESRDPETIREALSVRVGDFPRCATYIIKLILEGSACAYLSKGVRIWDIGPPSLLLDKADCSILDLNGKPVDFGAMARPPFSHPALVALPRAQANGFLGKLKTIL